MTSFTLTNSIKNGIEYLYADEKNETLLISKIIHTIQIIVSCNDCGIINLRNMVDPNVQEVNEFKHFNSCLHKKVTIDIDGKIKNCPSMEKDYGFNGEVSLLNVIKKDSFKTLWNIKKDDVLICKDCEYRYVCTDWRAFFNNPYLGIREGVNN